MVTIYFFFILLKRVLSSCSKSIIINELCWNESGEDSFFPDFLSALKHVNENEGVYGQEHVCILLMDDSQNFTYRPEVFPAETLPYIVFSSWSTINLEIFSKSPSGKTKLIFGNGVWFLFEIKNGSLKWSDIEFIGSRAVGSTLEFSVDETARGNIKWKGFFTFFRFSKVTVEFISCRFEKIITSIINESVQAYSSLFFIEETDSNKGDVELFLRLIGCEFLSLHYPRGIVYSYPKAQAVFERKSVFINSTNCTFRDIYNPDFLHWFDKNYQSKASIGYYYDFHFIINNTIFLLENASIMNSSRLLLADTANIININKLYLSSPSRYSSLTKPQPTEFMYFIQMNQVLGKNLTFFNFSLTSYDDIVNEEKDGTFFELPLNKSLMLPSNLMEFEKNQAFIKFCLFNNVELSMIVFDSGSILKKENAVLGIISIGTNNKLSIMDLTVNNVIMDSNSIIGSFAFIHVTCLNEIHFISISFNSFEGYGYSLAQILFLLMKNYLILENLNLNKILMKSKASLQKVKELLSNIRYNPTSLFISYMKSFALTNFGLCILGNKVVSIKSIGSDVSSLYGGFFSMAFMNEVSISFSKFEYLSCEQLSNFLAFSYNNYVIGAYINISNTLSTLGVFYLDSNNTLNLTNSYFLNNNGKGDLLFFDLYSSSIFSIAYFNTVIVINFDGKQSRSNLYGGTLTLGIANSFMVINGLFENSDAANSNSVGGVVFLNISNYATFKNCIFRDNKGNLGGVLGAFYSNNVIFESCLFELNIGLKGSVIYIEHNTSVIIYDSQFQTNKGSLNGGILYTSSSFNYLNFSNCALLWNQVPYINYWIETKNYNEIILKNISVEYGVAGEGGFVGVSTYAHVTIQSLTIRKSYKLEQFLNADRFNFIFVAHVQLEDIRYNQNFFNLNSSNILVILTVSLINSNLEQTDGSLFYTGYNNNFTIQNLSLKNITANNDIVLKAVSLNTVKLQEIQLVDIKLTENGKCFWIGKNNIITINDSLFANFYGSKNAVFLFDLVKFNKITLENLFAKGNFTFEQGDLPSSSIFLIGSDNTLSLKNITVNIVNNYDESKQISTLTFFFFQGQANSIIISFSNFKMTNISSLLLSIKPNQVSIKDSLFHEVVLHDDLLTLSTGVTFFYNLKFFFIFLKKDKYLFKITDASFCIIRKIEIYSNINFFYASSSNLEVLSSKINSCFGLKQNEKFGRVLSLEKRTVASFRRVEILCRVNLNDSLIVSRQSQLSFENCLVAFNEGIEGGFASLEEMSNLTLVRNMFILNKAVLGGVIFISEFRKMIIINNTFFGNRAYRYDNSHRLLSPGKGGSFYITAIEYTSLKDLSLVFKSNILKFNGAEIGGITYYMSGILILQRILKLSLNQTNDISRSRSKYYGDEKASFPYNLAFLINDNLIVFNEKKPPLLSIEEEINPRANYSSCLLLVVNIDIFGQISFYQQSLFERIFKFKDVNIYFTSLNSIPCLYTIKPLTYEAFTKYSNEKGIFSFKTSEFSKNSTNSTFTISFKLKKCQTGEYFDLNKLECLDCEPNFFSFESNFLEPSTCKSCTLEPFYCYGGFNLTPKSSYWRSSPRSKLFFKCPYSEACLGDPFVEGSLSSITIMHMEYAGANPVGVCAFGFEGVLCDKCSPGFSKINGVRCTQCDNYLSIIIIILKILLRMFFYIFMVMKAFKFCKSITKNKISLALVYSNFMIKILIIHIQFMKVYLGFPFKIPQFFLEFFKLFELSYSAGLENSANIDCFFKLDGSTMRYISDIFSVLNPTIFVFIVIIGASIFKNFCSKSKATTHRLIRAITTGFRFSLDKIKLYKMLRNSYFPYFLLISYMLSYDGILSRLMENFSYVNVNEGGQPDYRLVGDYKIELQSISHLRWLYFFAIPLSFIIGVLIPFFILFNIYKGKKESKMNEPDFLYRFGYFIFPYSPNHNFYEFFYMARKMFLIALDIFFIRIFPLFHKNHSTTLMVIMCLVFTSLSFYCSKTNPYNTKKYSNLNKIEYIFVTVQAILCWIGCLKLSIDEEDSEAVYYKVLEIAFFTLASAANLFAFIIWIYNYWKFNVKERLIIMIHRLRKMTSRINSPKKMNTNNYEVDLKLRKVSTFSKAVDIFKSQKQSSKNFLKLDFEGLNQRNPQSRISPDQMNYNKKFYPPENQILAVDIDDDLELSLEDQEKIPDFVIEESIRLAGDMGVRAGEYSEAFKMRGIYLGDSSNKMNHIMNRCLSAKYQSSLSDLENFQPDLISVLQCRKNLIGSKLNGYWLAIYIECAWKNVGTTIIESTHAILSSEAKTNFLVCYSSPTISDDNSSVSFEMKLRYEHFEKLKLHDTLPFRLWLPSTEFQFLKFSLDVSCFDFLHREGSSSPSLFKRFDSHIDPIKEKAAFKFVFENILILLAREQHEFSYHLYYKITNENLKFGCFKAIIFDCWLNNLRNSDQEAGLISPVSFRNKPPFPAGNSKT